MHPSFPVILSSGQLHPSARFQQPSIMVRISIPRIDYVPDLPPSVQVSVEEAASRLAEFLQKGTSKTAGKPGSGNGTVVLCGAGASVDR